MNRPERTFTTDQIRLERRLPSYWRVTFDMPPVNIFGPKQLPLLGDIITEIETDPQVKVVVFDFPGGEPSYRSGKLDAPSGIVGVVTRKFKVSMSVIVTMSRLGSTKR